MVIAPMRAFVRFTHRALPPPPSILMWLTSVCACVCVCVGIFLFRKSFFVVVVIRSLQQSYTFLFARCTAMMMYDRQRAMLSVRRCWVLMIMMMMRTIIAFSFSSGIEGEGYITLELCGDSLWLQFSLSLFFFFLPLSSPLSYGGGIRAQENNW